MRRESAQIALTDLSTELPEELILEGALPFRVPALSFHSDFAHLQAAAEVRHFCLLPSVCTQPRTPARRCCVAHADTWRSLTRASCFLVACNICSTRYTAPSMLRSRRAHHRNNVDRACCAQECALRRRRWAFVRTVLLVRS